MEDTNDGPDLLRAKINQETAKIPWGDLLRFFARGRVIQVNRGLDLVEVAALASGNRTDEIEAWMSTGKIATVSDEQAQHWLRIDALLWAVVVKPWVFVQEIKKASKQVH